MNRPVLATLAQRTSEKKSVHLLEKPYDDDLVLMSKCMEMLDIVILESGSGRNSSMSKVWVLQSFDCGEPISINSAIT